MRKRIYGNEYGGSNQKYLQEKLASLEGGEDCLVLASGVAAAVLGKARL